MSVVSFEGPASEPGEARYADTVDFLHEAQERAARLAQVSPELAEQYADHFFKVELITPKSA